MENQNPNQPFSDYAIVEGAAKPVASKKFMANVFLWMFAALAISALFAGIFSASPVLLGSLISAEGTGLNLFGYIVMFAPLGFVLLMSFGFARLSASAMIGLFILYAAINGISFSFILLAYTASSVLGCFISASAMFGIMAFMGYTTNKDLTSFGRIMMMGLIGIVIAMIVNYFLQSERMDYIISIIGVMVFTGLTAYDVQKLKRVSEGVEYEGINTASATKMSVLGALTLYLDFVNLFLMLLRLFGGKKD
jgi:FtsH-binding integral membrane protein